MVNARVVSASLYALSEASESCPRSKVTQVLPYTQEFLFTTDLRSSSLQNHLTIQSPGYCFEFYKEV